MPATTVCCASVPVSLPAERGAPRRVRWRTWAEGAALILLVVASGWLRLRGLGALPPGLHFDEAAYGLLAERVRSGHFVAFFSEFNGREPLYAYLVALAQLGFGETAFAERLPSALVGTLTIPATFFAVRELFAASPRDRWLAWLAALAVATSFWALHSSRQGERAGLVALVGALAIGATWRGFRLGSFGWTITGGLLGGLTLYTYLAARFFPLLAACAVGYFALRHATSLHGAGRRARRRSWRQWRGRWRPLAAAWLGAASLVAAPLASHFLLHPADLVERTGQVSALSRGGLPQVARNLVDAARMLVIDGSGDLKYTLPGRPIFDPANGLLFGIGLLVCLGCARRSAPHAALLGWGAVLLLPAILSVEGNHPLRSAGILPAVMAIWAVGADASWRVLSRQLGRAGQLLGLMLLVATVLGGFGLAYRDYFGRWANDPRLYGAMDGEYVDLAAYLRTLPDDGTPRVIAAEALDYPTIVYLTPAARDWGWVDPSQALLIPAAARAGGRLDYIVPDRVIGTRAVPPDWYAALGVEPRIEPFRNNAGRIIGKRYRFDLPPTFARGTFAPPALACPPDGANFNDDLSLLGWRTRETAQPGTALPLTLYWEARGPGRRSWQIFVHLVATPDAPHRLAQQDANGAFARGLAPGDLVIGRYQLALDPAVQAGPTLFQIGLYDLDTARYPRAPLLTAACTSNTTRDTVILPGPTIQP